MPPSERYVFSFNSKEELKKWHLYSDSEYGGMSFSLTFFKYVLLCQVLALEEGNICFVRTYIDIFYTNIRLVYP